MSYQTSAYDKVNDDGFPPDPVVVLVVEGTHDVSRLVNLLMSGNCEQVGLGEQVLRQVRRHSGGQAALRLLAAHGGPDLLTELGKDEPSDQYRDVVLHMLALAPDEYRQCIVAARASMSDGDYAKNNGRAEMIRVFATGLAERAGLPVADWEQIKQAVPADGVYRSEVTAQ